MITRAPSFTAIAVNEAAPRGISRNTPSRESGIAAETSDAIRDVSPATKPLSLTPDGVVKSRETEIPDLITNDRPGALFANHFR
jgi:hypothetical protein